MESCVLAAARELFDARQFPGVVAACEAALVGRPRDVALRLLRARALLALRRDAAVQVEVSEILRLAPACGAAYRLLGELAARRDQPQAARGFLHAALRCAPGDEEATVWLQLVDAMFGPTAVADASPAGAAAVGDGPAPLPRAHVRLLPRVESTPAPMAVVASPPVVSPPAPVAVSPPAPVVSSPPVAERRAALPPPLPPHVVRRGPARGTQPPPLPPPRRFHAPPALAQRLDPPPPTARPEGFGAYLVDVGILGELQWRAAMAYKRSTGVRLGAAVVALGFASETRIESASLVYHGRHRRPSTVDVIATARARRHADGLPA